jgi:hypothetical protein
MNKLLMCLSMSCMLFSATALADISLDQWLDKQAYRGNQIEVIRVASKKALVATEEIDADIEIILKEAEALEDDDVDREKVEDSS